MGRKMKSFAKPIAAILGLILFTGAAAPKINTSALFPDGYSEISVPSFGWGQRGNITIGDYSGTYYRERGTTSHGFVGFNKERIGASVELLLTNSKTGKPATANCQSKTKSVGGSTIRMQTVSWNLDCEFKIGDAAPIKLIMLENPDYTMRAGDLRQGAAKIGETEYKVASIHERQNGSRSIGPIGYSFSKDNKAIGAVETNNANKIYLAPALSETESGFVQTAGAVFLVMWEAQ